MPQAKKQKRGRITKSPATQQTVDERARELSAIAGRRPNRPIESDVEQARRELTGDERVDEAADDPDEMAEQLDERPYSTGHKIENQLPDDDETTERMVQEGVDEAEHDEMVAARKSRHKSEG